MNIAKEQDKRIKKLAVSVGAAVSWMRSKKRRSKSMTSALIVVRSLVSVVEKRNKSPLIFMRFFMMTLLEQIRQAEQELDEAYKAELLFQLQQQMRQYVVDWSAQHGQKFEMAVFSAVNGRWDDVRNDLRKGRLSFDEGKRLLDEFLRVELISPFLYQSFLEQFELWSRNKEQPMDQIFINYWVRMEGGMPDWDIVI